MSNEIWVVVETRNGEPTRNSSQVLGAAAMLSAQREHEVCAILLGSDADLASAIAPLAAKVICMRGEALSTYDVVVRSGAIGSLLASRGAPAAILAPASIRASEVMPRVAASGGCGYAAACVGLRWADASLAARRPAYGGKVYEEIVFHDRTAIVTLRPGTFPGATPSATSGAIEEVTVELPQTCGVVLVSRQESAGGKADISDAATVVAGGRGVQGESFQMVEALADVLDGAAAASRALVDAGEQPHEQQVGKSGKTVAPELYIACGISGAIHHTLGMNTAKVVVAVNSDPDAAIFQTADYGLVGDAATLLPELIGAIKAAKG